MEKVFDRADSCTNDSDCVVSLRDKEKEMKFILMLLCVSACSTHTDPVCKVTYPVMAGDSNYEVEASADTTSEAETLAFRVINKACGGYYPTRRVSVLSETFATDKKATVRIQFACVK